jgi:quinol monooxygenase YgiN
MKTVLLCWVVLSATILLTASPRAEKTLPEQLVDRIQAVPGLAKSEFSLVVTLKTKPDQVGAMIEAAKKVEKPSREEKGCIRYEFQQNQEDPAEFVLLETWKDLKALEAHFATPHFAELGKQFPMILAGPPQIRITQAVTKK